QRDLYRPPAVPARTPTPPLWMESPVGVPAGNRRLFHTPSVQSWSSPHPNTDIGADRLPCIGSRKTSSPLSICLLISAESFSQFAAALFAVKGILCIVGPALLAALHFFIGADGVSHLVQLLVQLIQLQHTFIHRGGNILLR